ncbi:MAG: response regulator [Armatimonadetes bacterium]|nr:response regulator [Armatimonadota bacterium]
MEQADNQENLGLDRGNSAEQQPLRATVLVIDDEPGIRKGCQRVLCGCACEVLLAETAEQGLEQLRVRPDIAVALVDIKMPGMGGLEFLSRAAELAPELVCVVITAYATIDTAIEATKRGAHDFLTKPFTPDELLHVVTRAIDHANLVRERNRLQAERQRRLLQLATEQSRLKTVINCMADAVLVCNAEHELVLYNPAALRVLPRVREPGRVYRLGEVLEPAELFALIGRACEARKRLSQEVKLVHLPEPSWVLADVAPVIDEDSGQFLGTVTVLRDITELKRVEQVKAQFVNMVAHELRAPVAAVDGYLSVILDGLAADPEKQREMLQRSRERLGALLKLVNDLLEVARIEAGAVRREIGPQSVADVIVEVADLLRPLAAEKDVTMDLCLSSQLPPVYADRNELVSIVRNLVDNAIKYNRPGGRVTVTAAPDGPYVRISVADTGVGISEEGKRRLFSEFFREKRPETAYIVGTGLGLSIVKRLVDFYHGRIEVESVVNEGSTFSVWLPYGEPVPERASGGEGFAA